GGATAIVGASTADHEAMIAMPILLLVGGFVFFMIMLTSVPGLIGGIGMLSYQQWSRVVVIVVSILNLLSFPFGTALGVYSLYVLLSQETGDLFKHGGVMPQMSAPQSPPPQAPTTNAANPQD
ncbi:hypothetical protein K8I31_16645, partial [bacterium]|nr:hypothetical protein [bacterium]